jgi:hypothetical protein
MFGLGNKNEPPENPKLGKLLDDMARDPEAHQDAFYKVFLTSNVFMIGESEAPGGGETLLKGGDKLRVMHWQHPEGFAFMPIFTSLSELKEATKDMGETPYIAFSGYDALNMTQGQVAVGIDPSNEHCLLLVPPQIAQILNYFDSIKDSLG